jgi:oligopeptide/dipeptide ABC transporter ATP-binding protein
MSSRKILVETIGLSRTFKTSKREVAAVRDVNLKIHEGETLALVGESGSGKSTTAKLILGLDSPDSGSVVVLGKVLNSLSANVLRELRSQIQVVQQNPYSQLNRRKSVSQIIATPLEAFGIGTKTDREQIVLELLKSVGLDESFSVRRPHELSGGQCQRVAIARALAPSPKILVLDEAVSALDLSIRAQIINLLKNIQRERNLTYLFITHDLGVAHYLADSVAVMYNGRIVEKGSRSDVFTKPRHHYTKSLLDAVPLAIPDKSLKQDNSTGAHSAPVESDACAYRSRCLFGVNKQECASQRLDEIVDEFEHSWFCHFPLTIKEKYE